MGNTEWKHGKKIVNTNTPKHTQTPHHFQKTAPSLSDLPGYTLFVMLIGSFLFQYARNLQHQFHDSS
jgi:hypothetical protein